MAWVYCNFRINLGHAYIRALSRWDLSLFVQAKLIIAALPTGIYIGQIKQSVAQYRAAIQGSRCNVQVRAQAVSAARKVAVSDAILATLAATTLEKQDSRSN